MKSDSMMEEISARLNALEQCVRERDQHLNTMLQQSALQAQSCTTSVPHTDLHQEMLARVQEFDGDDDKWLGWWFKLQSFGSPIISCYEWMIERIVAETDVANLHNAVLGAADKKLSSSRYYVFGLTMTDESKSLKIVRNLSVGEGAIAFHNLLAEWPLQLSIAPTHRAAHDQWLENLASDLVSHP